MSVSTRDDDERPIPLRVANQKTYVWVVEGSRRTDLFKEFRLLFFRKRSGYSFGQGTAIIIGDSAAHKPPSSSQISQWHSEQAESMKTQLAGIESKNPKERQGGGRALSEEAQMKQKERDGRKRVAKVAKALAEGEEKQHEHKH
ncbi:hypothetical protein DFP72DRAFT_850577 [Ephemerocybe angulata]|uniref:Uncharacterized protein n=1 Tax=Ephemerocybe angulata TaxID=980116 RepID=A0A8H6M190_9AGAR|nr:hypothetical protein DFP72DRAFT_850577 [Tulosesus angulatus]